MKKIIFTLAAVGMLSACSLDETPYGFYSSDNFYTVSYTHLTLPTTPYV